MFFRQHPTSGKVTKANPEVNLSELQKVLDSQSLELVSTQQHSLDSRKRLVEQTKEFRKNPQPQLDDFKSLLKDYQKEIDAVSKRSKQAEGYFLALYKTIAEVPDPCPLLESAIKEIKEISEAQALQVEHDSLVTQLAEANSKLEEKARDEETIRALQDTIENYKVMQETIVAERVTERTKSLQQELEDHKQQFKDAEYSLQKEVEHLKAQYISLKSQEEYSKATTGVSSFEAGTEQVRVELLELDLGNAKSKIEQQAQEILNLKAQIAPKNDNELIFLQERYSTLEEAKLQQEEELNETISKLRNELSVMDQNVQSANNQALEIQAEVTELRKKLEAQQDYDEVKRELLIFRQIEGGSNEDVPLERILLDKNKKLENEITDLRNESGRLKKNIEQNQELIKSMMDELESKKNLILQLEKDIERPPDLGNLIDKKSIVPILTSQRDRYKKRFEEGQDKILSLQREISHLNDEISVLKKDNVILYEKLRYQETYTSNSRHQSNASRRNSGTIEKYRQRYEDAIDPFLQFKQQQQQNLNSLDKLALQLTRILQIKYARLVFLGYAFVLHLLVFFSLYEVMAIEMSKAGEKVTMSNGRNKV